MWLMLAYVYILFNKVIHEIFSFGVLTHIIYIYICVKTPEAKYLMYDFVKQSSNVVRKILILNCFVMSITTDDVIMITEMISCR